MARRRLGPVDPAFTNVPRAEHSHHPDLLTSRGPAAPIARVAAEAAGTAALQELTESMARARETGRLVLDLPLNAIAPDHLLRDRLPVEDDEMSALRASIRTHGQRTPIEVTPLTGALPYGLVSGWRRLMALKALYAETSEDRFGTVQALVRRPETVQDAYVAMVEENEIRLGLSHYERARVAALATRRGIFPSEKTALLALFATASRPKRSRIRAFLEIYHALDGTLRFPAHLPERLGLKLVELVRAGQDDRIVAAITGEDPRTPDAERTILTDLVKSLPGSERTSRLADEILPGVTFVQSLRGRTLTLTLKGMGVTPELAEAIQATLRRLNTLR